MKKLSVFLIAAVAFALLFSACGTREEVRELYLMDTVSSFRISGEAASLAADEAEACLSELDRELSAFSEGGELWEINENGGGSLSERLGDVLRKAEEYSALTDNAFSATLGSVIELWSVGEKNYVPTKEEIEEAKRKSDPQNMKLSDGTVSLSNGAKLNLGAIAKGYASDLVRDILIKHGVENAVISLGGNIYVRGKNPSGEAWKVGIRDPFLSENDYMGILSVSEKFIISSGDYERFFEKDGARYHHIMDIKTGAPAESDIASVTVISENGALGDALSTALFVMGKEKALEFWRENEGFELVIIDKNKQVTVTEGIEGSFFATAEGGYAYETASR